MHDATLRYVAKKVEAKAKGKSLEKGVVKEIIREIQVEMKLSANTIKPKTIYSRVRRKSLTSTHPGLVSPLTPSEGILMSIFKQRVSINQLLNAENSIKLVTLLIVGTKYEEKLKKYHQYKHVLEEKSTEANISRKYWQSFKIRHKMS